ncbi:MAG TPA: LysR family transcriptional regulator [Roseiarcus sp.]|jgi:DNA-binding transcriptional LysR family regulator
MDVSLRQVRSFLAVARVKSFTGAASVLHVTQPALTVQIRRLEEALGVTLFDRDTRSVELTRVARDLLPPFERALQDFDAAVGSARDIATQARGIVRLAALPSVAAGILPDAILQFRQQRPNVMFDLRDVIAGQVLTLVQSEQVDFGVMGGAIKAVDVETVFEAQDRLHVVYPKGHRVARLKKIKPVALSEFPLILMQRDTSVRAVVDAGFHAAGLIPKATCEAIYMMTAVGMVRAGLGLTILPGSAREIRAEPGLLSKPIDDPRFTRPVSIIKRSGRTLPPMSEAFLEHLSVCLRAALA